MKAIKLIFFADRYHIRKYGRPITRDEYFAMFYGPVNSGVKDVAEMSQFLGPEESSYAEKFLEASRYEVASIEPLDDAVFSESDLEALSFAWEKFGPYDQFELADISHRYPEWKKHEETLKENSRVRMSYEDFLDDPENEFEKCFELSPEGKECRREEVEELARLEALRG